MPREPGQAGDFTEEVIDRAMILRAAEAIRESGALAQPEIGVAALAERVLRKSLFPRLYGNKGSKAGSGPSQIAVELDQYL